MWKVFTERDVKNLDIRVWKHKVSKTNTTWFYLGKINQGFIYTSLKTKVKIKPQADMWLSCCGDEWKFHLSKLHLPAKSTNIEIFSLYLSEFSIDYSEDAYIYTKGIVDFFKASYSKEQLKFYNAKLAKIKLPFTFETMKSKLIENMFICKDNFTKYESWVIEYAAREYQWAFTKSYYHYLCENIKSKNLRRIFFKSLENFTYCKCSATNAFIYNYKELVRRKCNQDDMNIILSIVGLQKIHSYITFMPELMEALQSDRRAYWIHIMGMFSSPENQFTYHELIDGIRMFQYCVIEGRTNKRPSIKDGFMKWHDDLSNIRHSIPQENSICENNEFSLHLDNQILEGYRFKVPKDTDEVRKWGVEMHHCLGSYAPHETFIILGLYKGDKLTWNMTFQLYKGKLELHQMKGFNNEDPPSDLLNKLVTQVKTLYRLWKTKSVDTAAA
jgi:hypothetical protein